MTVTNKHNDIKNDLYKIAFAANEISTPVSNISGIVQIVDMMLDADTINVNEIKSYLKKITKNCDMHDRTINNIVSFCYPQVRDYRLLKIKDFVEKFSAQLEPYSSKYNFDFQCKLTTQADEFNLPVSLIEEMLLALIVNSVQYNSKNQKKVSLTITQCEGNLVFAVKDNGDGINEDKLIKVEDSSGKFNTIYSGPGYGLQSVQKAINTLGGTLEIKSTLKKGTEITFSIPEKKHIQLRSSNYEYKPSSSVFRIQFSIL